jgi:hypothetical protein
MFWACKNPKCNPDAHCKHLIHSFDLQALLRLDVKLESIFRASASASGNGLSLEFVKKCLQTHRKQMFDESAELIAKHSSRLAEMKTRLPTSCPRTRSFAFTSKAASFRASDVFPQICFYMEVVESKGVFIPSLIGLPDGVDLPKILPDSYRASTDFQHLLAQNARRQFLQRPAVVSSTCSIALKNMLGFKAEGLKKLEVKCRKDFGIADDVEFLLEPHLPKSMLLILCSEESKLQAVAASLQGQLNDIAAKLKTRVREVAVSGTSMRAVIGSGGECRELLLKPSQSISVRFSATNVTHRLCSPITTLTQVPKGFFSDLVTSCLCTDSANMSDDEVWKSVPNKYCGMTATKRSQAVDLQSMSVGQIVSAHPLLFLFPILPFSYLSLSPPPLPSSTGERH